MPEPTAPVIHRSQSVPSLQAETASEDAPSGTLRRAGSASSRLNESGGGGVGPHGIPVRAVAKLMCSSAMVGALFELQRCVA